MSGGDQALSNLLFHHYTFAWFLGTKADHEHVLHSGCWGRGKKREITEQKDNREVVSTMLIFHWLEFNHLAEKEAGACSVHSVWHTQLDFRSSAALEEGESGY